MKKITNYIEAIIRKTLPESFYLFALKVQSISRLKPRKLLRLEINLVDHCNLKCAGCEHFSPLVKESFIDTSKLEKDFQRLSTLTNSKIELMHLMGGEP